VRLARYPGRGRLGGAGRYVEVERTSRLGAAQLSWDDESRCGVLRFVDDSGSASGAEAEHLTADLQRWVDERPDERFDLLVDCTEIRVIDAAWRQRWADFFIAYRDRATLAWFNANAEVRLIVTMFRKGTGVTGEVFATEDEARAYLASVAA
jgi:hypothetical protein